MFRRAANAIVAATIVLGSAGLLCAQPTQDRASIKTVTDQTDCFSSKISGRETKWYRHEIGFISVCIPETMVRRRTERCADKCFIFENEDLFFDVDLSVSAWRPTFQKRFASYSGVSRTIDGKPSTVWIFEDTGKFKYAAGVNIILERGQVGMGVYLFSKTADPKPIADRMFNSIRFIKTEPN
ncbi:MAG: hypothetical protein ACJ72Z_08645 [Pyrinomonadaceae bacterium]